MKETTTVNIHSLKIWLAENGDYQARLKICTAASVSLSTLNKILKGHNPKFAIRYRIYKLTGIKLSEEDDFPPIKAIAS